MNDRRNKRLVIGDIHGGYRSMKQVLERANFNEDKDLLIGIGDYCDGWPDSFEVIEYLRNLPNFVGIKGNHDSFLIDWLYYFSRPRIWTSQGGEATLKSYAGKTEYFELHRKFLSNLPPYLVIDNKVFVHGGFTYPIEDNGEFDIFWDREMFFYTFTRPVGPPWNIGDYDEAYIGHTTTSTISKDLKPLHRDNIWAIDQGGGYEGKLTVIDIDTHEYWQSDNVDTLYPGVKGR